MNLFTLKVVTIESKTLRSEIYQKLVYKKKLRGRVLNGDVPALGLRKGHRLMPTPDLLDVAQFEFMAPPFVTSWWIGPENGRLVHDCPLLELAGVGLETWSLDILHSWHLGPLQLLVSLALNYCLDSGL